MKPQIWIYAFLLLSVTGLIGCEKSGDGPGGKPPFIKSYILSYDEVPLPDNVEAFSFPAEEPRKAWQISLGLSRKDRMTSQTPDYYLKNSGGYYSAEEKKRITVFDSLAEAHQDTEFNRHIRGFNHCLFVRTERIDIVSDQDYDQAHPAGTLLNDIVDIQFLSAEDYVLSQYTEGRYLGQTTEPELTYDPLRKTYHPTDNLAYLQESLEEFNRIKRKLIAFHFSFRFRSAPAQGAYHNFTITYENERGTRLSGRTGRQIPGE